jgi:hypothetical protein
VDAAADRGACTGRRASGIPVVSTPGANWDLLEGLQRAGITWDELWVRYVGLGGDAAQMEVEGYVLNVLAADDYQHNLIAHALNEYFLEHNQNHPVRYRRWP